MTCWAFVDFFFFFLLFPESNFRSTGRKKNDTTRIFFPFWSFQSGILERLWSSKPFAAENVVVLNEPWACVYLNARHCISLSAIVQRYSTFWDWTCSRWSLLVTLPRAARWLRFSSIWTGFTFTLKSKSVWEFFSQRFILHCGSCKSASTSLHLAHPKYGPVASMACADWPVMRENAWWPASR